MLQEALAEDAPDGKRQTPAIVTRDLRAPEAPGDELARILRDLPELMTSVATLRVPLKVDVGHGPNWERAH